MLVAAAWLEREGRLLLARRGPGGPCAGLWEFPGGKCQQGESLGECLVRELAEELNLSARAGEELAAVEHDYGTFSISLHLLRAEAQGEPQALGCAEWRWVAPGEVASLELAPADRRLWVQLGGGRH